MKTSVDPSNPNDKASFTCLAKVVRLPELTATASTRARISLLIVSAKTLLSLGLSSKTIGSCIHNRQWTRQCEL